MSKENRVAVQLDSFWTKVVDDQQIHRQTSHLKSLMPKKDLDPNARLSQRVVAQLAEEPYSVPAFVTPVNVQQSIQKALQAVTCAPRNSCFYESVSFVVKCTLDQAHWPSPAF